MTPYLTKAEIDDICDPLKLPGAQVRHLQRLGMIVKRKPNGQPLVARGEFDRVMIGRQTEPQPNKTSQPNRAGLLQLINTKSKHGPQAY